MRIPSSIHPVIPGLICFLGFFITRLLAQQPGLDAAPAILPFLNGNLPSLTPQEGDAWQLVDAFPSLTFEAPMQLLPVPGTTRLMLAEKKGILKVFENNASTSSITTLIDLSDQVEGGGDSGFFSVAFHPEFGQGGSPNAQFLYVYYRYTPDTDEGEMAYCRLSRLTWSSSDDSIDPASEFILIQQYDRQGWHNGGGLFFGNEGFLYLAIGDEGGANDLYDATQKINIGLLSGVFRIDVDQQGGTVSHPIRRQPQNPAPPPSGWPDSFSQGYYIPNDNPWLDPAGLILEEFWALGARSPHRMTIDRPTGDIYLGDVGQWDREEISLVVAGANLQWPYREGSIPGPKSKPTQLIGIDTPPLLDYADNDGSCVIGGYVYRGQNHLSSLGEKYIFGDYETGGIWAVTRNGINVTKELLLTADFGPSALTSFGFDASDEIYTLSRSNSNQASGKIHRLTRVGPSSPQPPVTLSQTGAFSDVASLTPSSGFIPYRVNAPLWSDGAMKSRWIAIPNDGTPDEPGEQIVYSENGNWQFPVGTVIIKQFTIAGRRVETRFLVHGTDGRWFGFTYRWREDQSDADLLLTGEEETFSNAGQSYQWSFPSRADCLRCHTSSADRVLGLRTRQLNGNLFYPSTGRIANQLITLNRLGFFSEPLEESEIPNLLTSAAIDDPTASLELRARSYLDSNCAHCHTPEEGIREFDYRLTTPLNLAGVLNGPVVNNFGYTGATEITPGDAWLSMAWIRQNTSEPSLNMPPLGRHTVDTEAINVLYQWIESLEPSGSSFPSDLMSSLSFEETSGDTASDQTANGNDGQLDGATTWINGHSGSGIATDGLSGLLRITHSSDIHLGENNHDFTVAFWVNLQEDFTGSWRGLAGKGSSWDQRALGVFLRPDSNQLEISISTSDAYNEGFSTASSLPVGEWRHLAFVKEGSELRAYFDGQFDRSTTLAGTTLGTLEDFYLGRGPGGAEYTSAHFDSLQIYNRALSLSELQQVMSNDNAGGPSPDSRALFDEVISLTGLSGTDAEPESAPFEEGVSNLMKYAFNLDLNGLDYHAMQSGGISGIPATVIVDEVGTLIWRIEYVRRRKSGLIYTPMISTQLTDESFTPLTAEETVTPIDQIWERVVNKLPISGRRSFSRIRVTLP